MAQFTMVLANPAVTSGNSAVIYTDLTGGNKLNVTLTNQTGEGLTITDTLLIKFPKTIMDEDGIGAITVTGSDWATDGYYTPETDPDSKDNGAYYILKLLAKGDGVAFNDTTTINLETINPSAKGNGQTHAVYIFSAQRLAMDAATNLGVTARPSPDNKPLVGPTNALNLTMRVNDGGPANPLVFTAPTDPVTAKNAAQNKIHLNFDFQDLNISNADGTGDNTLGKLVQSWPKDKPPTFQLQFPYFNDAAPLAPKFALTDDKSQGDEGYNAYTSARNIQLSLSSINPNVLTNDWWTITPPADNVNAPFWLIRPTAKNLYLFTGTTQGANSPGPFLDLYFSHIYSNLQVDDQNPETILYVENLDFPGYNDAILQQTLFKEHSVQIESFSGNIEIQSGTTTLVLSWRTNAKEVYISGDSNTQAPISDGTYRKSIDLTTPLYSQYTLTAVGDDGVSRLERTIAVQWKESSSVSPTTYNLPSSIAISPDGSKLYLPSSNTLYKLDSSSLSGSLSNTIDLGNDTAKNVAISPDGNKFYLATLTAQGGGTITAYDVNLNKLDQPVLSPGRNGGPNLYPMAMIAESFDLAITMAQPADATGPRVAAYNTSTMNSLSGSPYLGNNHSVQPIGIAYNDKYGHLYYPDTNGLGVLDASTLQPVANAPVSINSTQTITYHPGPIAVSPDRESVITLGIGYKGEDRIFVLCVIDAATLTLKKNPVEVNTGYSNAPFVVSTGIVYSQDGAYVIVFGADYSEGNTTHGTTVMNVYDPTNLSEVVWSPITVSHFYGTLVAAPDGSKFYANAMASSTATTGNVVQLIPFFS